MRTAGSAGRFKRVDRVEAVEQRTARQRDYESVRAPIVEKIKDTKGMFSAKRSLPAVRAAGCAGSDRDLRRLLAQERSKYRQAQARERFLPPCGLGAG